MSTSNEPKEDLLYEEDMMALTCTMDDLLEQLEHRDELPTAQRADLLGQLEAVTHQVVEREEQERIRTTIQKAMDSGLIETPVATQDLGECPLCFEDIPNATPTEMCHKLSTYHRLFCCGAVCCVKCIDERDQRFDCKMEQMERSPTSVQFEMELDEQNGTMMVCPFCRSPNHGEEHFLGLVQRNAESGKSWAQFKWGQMILEGKVKGMVGHYNAVKWFELAANDGHLLAMTKLYHLWKTGFAEVGIAPNMEKAIGYVRQAARKGHFLAQCYYGQELKSDPEALIWYTLSAAQGFWHAQRVLGTKHATSCFTYDPLSPIIAGQSVFTCLYWVKKAALQGTEHTQDLLPSALLHAKALIFRKEVNLVGHSVVPEACFWFDVALEGMSQNQARDFERKRPESLQVLRQCACCGLRSGGAVRMQRCGKCKGAGYCGRDCQVKHWKMGHKRDCQTVEDCRRAMVQPRPGNSGRYPVKVTPP